MGKTASDHLLERLSAWGVKRIFGYPGDGINGIMGALDRAKDRFEYVQVRHEEQAAFMACAHAKFTGEIGVCLATSGPGAIHLLNGLYDAKLDHQPVLAIVGQQPSPAIGGNYQQEVDLVSLFKDVAHEYVHMAASADQIRHLVDRGIRIAIDQRTPTCIIVPGDVQDADAVEDPDWAHGTVHTAVGRNRHPRPVVVPAEEDLQLAAGILNEGEKVAMLIGQGAMHAEQEVTQVADTLGAGVAKALLGRAVLDDREPWVTGSIGLLGTKPSWELMANCDTLLMVGTSFPYSEFLPPDGQARGVQIDLDGRMLGIRYPMEANLLGDSATTLRALMPHLKRKPDRSWREKIEDDVRQWWKVIEDRAMQDADPLNPQRVFYELSPRLPDGAIITCDSGSSANWFARDLKLRRGMMASLSGTLASMGSGVPYAIAAKFAHPERPVFALVGDGAMQMNGNAELLTLMKYLDRLPDKRFVVLVLKNLDLNQVTWEQRALEGDPRFDAAQHVPDFPYHKYAEMIGMKGIFVDDPDDVGAAWDEALATTDRPVLVEAHTDPNVPPMPPHIEWEQAKNMLMSMMHGDSQLGGVMRQSFKDKVAEFVPGRIRS